MPSAGPYYVASYRPEQGAVLKRNPNYHGSRPHAFDEIDYETAVSVRRRAVREIDAGTSDYAVVGGDLPNGQLASLAARYGSGSPAARAGRQRYFVNPLFGFAYLALNTSRPLFANVDLRKAVNYALDRRAITQGCGFSCQPTDQYLQSGIPGFRDTHVYPLTPDLARAKRLARGHGGRAVLYAGVESGTRGAAHQGRTCAARDHRPDQDFGSFALGHIAGRRGEPFDMALTAGFPPSPTLPTSSTTSSTGARSEPRRTSTCPISTTRTTTASSPPQRDSTARGVTPPTGRSRPTSCATQHRQHRSRTCQSEFFSARIGCQVYQPVYRIDLAALCLRSP